MIELIYIILLILIIIFYILKYMYNYEYFTDIHHYNLDRDVIPQSSNNLSIENPIKDNYLSHQIDIEDFDNIDVIFDYKIIDKYKKILLRSPTQKEIKLHRLRLITGEQDDHFIKINLYNSTEYSIMKDTQLNDVYHELEYKTYEKILFDIIRNLYINYNHIHTLEHSHTNNKNNHKHNNFTDNNKIYENLLPHLKDILIHFQFDMYLFIAFLSSNKYKPFENELLETTIITKYKLRDIFYKHFILLELHNEANAIKQSDLKDGKSNIFKEIFNGLKERINKDREDQEKLLNELQQQKLKDYANSKKCEYPITKKIYNPISHNTPYKTNIAHNPPICTTLGKNNKLRVFPYKINDNKTNINEDTQIGSIMPKFNYNEYIEYQINNKNNNVDYDYTIKQNNSDKYLAEKNNKLKTDDRFILE